MGVGHYQESNGIVLMGDHADDAPSSPVLQRVELGRHSLNESPVTEGYHHPLVGNEVFHVKLYFALLAYLGAAGVAKLGLQFPHFILDEEKHPSRVAEQFLQISDGLQDLGIFVKYLLPLQVSQAA